MTDSSSDSLEVEDDDELNHGLEQESNVRLKGGPLLSTSKSVLIAECEASGKSLGDTPTNITQVTLHIHKYGVNSCCVLVSYILWGNSLGIAAECCCNRSTGSCELHKLQGGSGTAFYCHCPQQL